MKVNKKWFDNYKISNKLGINNKKNKSFFKKNKEKKELDNKRINN